MIPLSCGPNCSGVHSGEGVWLREPEAAAVGRVQITRHMRPNRSDGDSLGRVGAVPAPPASSSLFLQVCLRQRERWTTVPIAVRRVPRRITATPLPEAVRVQHVMRRRAPKGRI